MDWKEYPYSIENDKISLSVVFMWRDGRVVEGGGLENRCPDRDRGFESYSLRHLLTPIGRSIQLDSLDMAENRP